MSDEWGAIGGAAGPGAIVFALHRRRRPVQPTNPAPLVEAALLTGRLRARRQAPAVRTGGPAAK